MKIPQTLRTLVKDNSAKSMFEDIVLQVRSGKTDFHIYPKETNANLNSAFADKGLWDENRSVYMDRINRFHESREIEFLDALQEDGSIEWTNMDYEGGVDAKILTKNTRLLFKLEEWTIQLDRVHEFGDFCLNSLTGEAYCLDGFYQFVPGSGLFKLFDAFITREGHFLTHEEILKIQQNREELTLVEKNSLHDRSRERINEIKKAFSMPRLGKYLKSVGGVGYLLSPHKSV